MNGMLTIARRDLAERRTIFLTAAVLAVIPFAVLLIPGMQRHGTEKVVAVGGAFVASTFVLGLALLLGANFIGRDLADKRMSFYFARPVPGPAIWFGKLTAALATLAIAAAIIMIPAMLASGELLLPAWVTGAGALALVALTFFLLAHTVAAMFRSRSPLVLLDAGCAAIAIALGWYLFEQLAIGHAERLRQVLASIILGVLLTAIVAGGAWQVSRGRTDARRNHRELSRFLWSTVAAMLALLGAYVSWVVIATPSDLVYSPWVGQPPAGKWMMVAGPLEHRLDFNGAFYVNVENGAYTRGDARSVSWESFFTPDGQLMGQLRPIGDERSGPAELELVRFGEREATVTPTNLTFAEHTQPVASDDGTRVASAHNEVVTVHSLPDGRALMSAHLPNAPRLVRYFFPDRDHLRVFSQGEERMEIFEVDLQSRRLMHTGTLAPGGKMAFNASADGSRLLVHVAERELLLADGRSGAVLSRIASGGRGSILSDGRIAVVTENPGTLSIYSADGTLQREMPLPGVRIIPYLREVEGGTLLVGGVDAPMPSSPAGFGWTIFVADLGRNAIVRTARDLRPMPQTFYFGLGSRDPRRFVAPAETRLAFLAKFGEVVVWDPATMQQRRINAELRPPDFGTIFAEVAAYLLRARPEVGCILFGVR
jgi:hypothetical protein